MTPELKKDSFDIPVLVSGSHRSSVLDLPPCRWGNSDFPSDSPDSSSQSSEVRITLNRTIQNRILDSEEKREVKPSSYRRETDGVVVQNLSPLNKLRCPNTDPPLNGVLLNFGLSVGID